MGFIIKSAFWLSLVLLIIPIGGTDADGKSISPIEALWAARAAFNDVSGICERQPDVCVVGKSALHTIGVRAREGARMAYEALDAEGQTAAVADVRPALPVATDAAATGAIVAQPFPVMPERAPIPTPRG